MQNEHHKLFYLVLKFEETVMSFNSIGKIICIELSMKCYVTNFTFIWVKGFLGVILIKCNYCFLLNLQNLEKLLFPLLWDNRGISTHHPLEKGKALLKEFAKTRENSPTWLLSDTLIYMEKRRVGAAF